MSITQFTDSDKPTTTRLNQMISEINSQLTGLGGALITELVSFDQMTGVDGTVTLSGFSSEGYKEVIITGTLRNHTGSTYEQAQMRFNGVTASTYQWFYYQRGTLDVEEENYNVDYFRLGPVPPVAVVTEDHSFTCRINFGTDFQLVQIDSYLYHDTGGGISHQFGKTLGMADFSQPGPDYYLDQVDIFTASLIEGAQVTIYGVK